MEELFWQCQKVLLAACFEIAVLGLHGKVSGRDLLEQGKSLGSSALEEEGVAETTV